jgi:hypothetical protein
VVEHTEAYEYKTQIGQTNTRWVITDSDEYGNNDKCDSHTKKWTGLAPTKLILQKSGELIHKVLWVI